MVWRLETERLLLRPPEERDVPAIVSLIGEYEVAKNLSTVPHPYTENHAREYIERAAGNFVRQSDFGFQIERKEDGAFIGGVGLHLKEGTYEFGYWLGRPYWKNGYATEAARRVVEFAFYQLLAPSVWAGWYHDNPASGHVLAKIGCRPNGVDTRSCMARGHEVLCNLVILDRSEYVARRIAA